MEGQVSWVKKWGWITCLLGPTRARCHLAPQAWRGGGAHQAFSPASVRSGDAGTAWTRGQRGLSRGLAKVRPFLTLIHAEARLEEQGNNAQVLAVGVCVRRWS